MDNKGFVSGAIIAPVLAKRDDSPGYEDEFNAGLPAGSRRSASHAIQHQHKRGQSGKKKPHQPGMADRVHIPISNGAATESQGDDWAHAKPVTGSSRLPARAELT